MNGRQYTLVAARGDHKRKEYIPTPCKRVNMYSNIDKYVIYVKELRNLSFVVPIIP